MESSSIFLAIITVLLTLLTILSASTANTQKTIRTEMKEIFDRLIKLETEHNMFVNGHCAKVTKKK